MLNLLKLLLYRLSKLHVLKNIGGRRLILPIKMLLTMDCNLSNSSNSNTFTI